MVASAQGIDLRMTMNGAPAPYGLISQLRETEVTLSDDGRSGFQLTFAVGRAKGTGGYDLPGSALLQPFVRVRLSVAYGPKVHVLIDGVVLFQELQPGSAPNSALFMVTGEDVSAMMDLEEKLVAHPLMHEGAIATKILGAYQKYATPVVKPPPKTIQFDKNTYQRIQRETDRAYLNRLARRFGYRFYIKFGPVVNQAYWGPPELVGAPQPALFVDAGALTNVLSVRTNYDALKPHTYFASVKARDTDKVAPLKAASASATRPSLSTSPALAKLVSGGSVRKRIFSEAAGRTEDEAAAWAQGAVDASVGAAVQVEGELDAVRYGTVLQPRALVPISGVGSAFDGPYLVKEVTHTLRRGEYRQSFVLSREGLNAGGAR